MSSGPQTKAALDGLFKDVYSGKLEITSWILSIISWSDSIIRNPHTFKKLYR